MNTDPIKNGIDPKYSRMVSNSFFLYTIWYETYAVKENQYIAILKIIILYYKIECSLFSFF